MNRTLAALRAELRLAAMTALAYRASFFGEALLALLTIAWTLLPIFVLYDQRAGIAGWTRDEAMLVNGCFILLEGLMSALIEPNLRAVVEQVRDGTFDFVLMKPVDPQLQVSVHRTSPTRLPHALAGMGVVIWACLQLPTPPELGDIALAGLLLGSGLLILHSLFTLVVSTAFWFVRVDNLSYLLTNTLDVGRWPLTFYEGGLRFFLTFVVPIGLMTTWPAMALRGLLSPGEVVMGLAVALGFSLAGRLAWTTALRRYSSASS